MARLWVVAARGPAYPRSRNNRRMILPDVVIGI
jgi:hypothetical protein